MVNKTNPSTDFSLLPELGSGIPPVPGSGPLFSDQFTFGHMGGSTPQGSGNWSPSSSGGFLPAGNTPQGPAVVPQLSAWDSFKNWATGTTGADGQKTASGLGQVAGLGLGALSAWTGFQNLKLGREQLDAQRQASDRNFANQVSTTNRQLEDRQRARVATSPGSALSVADYMSKYKVG